MAKDEQPPKREALYVHVEPETKARINKKRKIEGVSQGILIDRAVAAYEPQKPEGK